MEDIVKGSFSFSEVISKLGYSTTHGRNIDTLKDRLNYYSISYEHFRYLGSRHNWIDTEIFCENSKVSQHKLRDTFKQKEFVPYQCNVCGLEPFWNNKPLVLTLDHINGHNKDNRIENLQWICPNCDRQSDTYGMKNKKTLQKGVILHNNIYAHPEKSSNNKIPQPSRQELKDILWKLKNYTQVANRYNVSPRVIRRWCREYNLPATINIIKHTSENGWEQEKWNDFYKPSIITQISKECYMVDKDTNEILMEFPSRKAAGKYIKPQDKNASIHISQVCNGNRESAYGYKWKDKIVV